VEALDVVVIEVENSLYRRNPVILFLLGRGSFGRGGGGGRGRD